MPRFDIFEYPNELTGGGMRVGIVMSRFNPEIGEALRSACIEELRRLGLSDADIEIATVPGALEIPLALQSMARCCAVKPTISRSFPTIPHAASWKCSSIPASRSPTAF